MAGYNPNVMIEAHDAITTVGRIYTWLLMGAGAGVGMALGALSPDTLYVALGGVIGGFAGLGLGYYQSLLCATFANLMLCVAKIEQNTRSEEEKREIAKQKEQQVEAGV